MKRGQHVIVTMYDLTEVRAAYLRPEGYDHVIVRLFEPYRSSPSDKGLRIVPIGCIEECKMDKIGAK